MLKILYSDRISDLAAALKGELLAKRAKADPFDFQQVVVPNGNVAKWLQVHVFAKEPNLCAGIDFPFMENRMTELLANNLPKERRYRFELLPDHAYASAILSVLFSDATKIAEYAALAPFRRYLQKDNAAGPVTVNEQREARMAWQLAEKLADLMDSYEVHRPEMVDAWLGKAQDPRNPAPPPHQSSTERAEAALARSLWGAQGAFPESGDRLSLRQLFDQVKTHAPEGPIQKIYFFGQSTFSLLQVRILLWLARTHEVVVFHNNPCREYWGDITTAREDRKAAFAVNLQGDDPERAFDCDNTLLKDLGIAGRETLRLFVDAEEANGNERDPDRRITFIWEEVGADSAEPKTMLQKLQQSIRLRTHDVSRGPHDASIQIVGAPGVRREVEMVYNSILGSVARPAGVTGERPWPDCQFSDIAVLVPDMKTYRPIIESVFEARGQIPYGLIDTTAGDDSQYLRGFLDLIELGRTGLNRERLFNVLENPCVQQALGFSREDVVDWRKLTEKLGAFENFEHDPAAGCFDWSWALRRLRLAEVANSATLDGHDLPLVKDGGAGSLKFSEVVELLYRDLKETLSTQTGEPRLLPCVAEEDARGQRVDCWSERLARLSRTYLSAGKDDALETRVQQTIFTALYSLRGIPGERTYELPVATIELLAGAMPCRCGNYLTSGVTIAGLMPMRPVPFKQVYVLGLGAGGFPGQANCSTLDLRGAGWRLGDVSMPNMNRFLFLETLMAVKDRLVLSYPNRDIEKDAELFPSGIVRELEAFLSEHVLNPTVPFVEFEDYPLLERGEPGKKNPTEAIFWNPTDPQSGILPTYSTAARNLARFQYAEQNPQSAIAATKSPVRAGRMEVSARELAAFIRDPIRAVMRYRFGIAVAGYLETELAPYSPLGLLQGPDAWALESRWLSPDGRKAVEAEIETLTRSGRFPIGFLGAFAQSKILKNDANVDSIRTFLDAFRTALGADNTLHLGCPAEIDGQKVRFVAEIPNWHEDPNGTISVLMTGNVLDKATKKPTDTKRQALPDIRFLDAFLAYLMKVGWTAQGERLRLQLGIADLNQGTSGIWNWPQIDAATAREYLTRLVRDYWSYGRQEPTGHLIDVSFKKFLEGIPAAFLKDRTTEWTTRDWTSLLEKTTKDDETKYKANDAKSTFDNRLVIEQNLAAFKRAPTLSELQSIFRNRYLLPLSGMRTTPQGEKQ